LAPCGVMTGAKIAAMTGATGGRTAGMTGVTGGMTAATGGLDPGCSGDSPRAGWSFPDYHCAIGQWARYASSR
jgi:hypothetical protein